MVRVSGHQQMVINILGNGRREKHMEREFISGVMGIDMKVSGRTS